MESKTERDRCLTNFCHAQQKVEEEQLRIIIMQLLILDL